MAVGLNVTPVCLGFTERLLGLTSGSAPDTQRS